MLRQCCSYSIAVCRRKGKQFKQSYRQGKPHTEMTAETLPRSKRRKGTEIQFLYDHGVFTER